MNNLIRLNECFDKFVEYHQGVFARVTRWNEAPDDIHHPSAAVFEALDDALEAMCFERGRLVDIPRGPCEEDLEGFTMDYNLHLGLVEAACLREGYRRDRRLTKRGLREKIEKLSALRADGGFGPGTDKLLMETMNALRGCMGNTWLTAPVEDMEGDELGDVVEDARIFMTEIGQFTTVKMAEALVAVRLDLRKGAIPDLRNKAEKFQARFTQELPHLLRGSRVASEWERGGFDLLRKAEAHLQRATELDDGNRDLEEELLDLGAQAMEFDF